MHKHVPDRRAGGGLLDDLPQRVIGRVSSDVEGDADVLISSADVIRETENAA